jgi:hypothetical protein
MYQVSLARLIVVAALAGAISLIADILVARAADTLEDAKEICDERYSQDDKAAERCMKRERERIAAAAFRPSQRMWQCNDIRVTETINQPWVVNYDLGGTIWGGSQFTLMLESGALYFNGRPCVPLR